MFLKSALFIYQFPSEMHGRASCSSQKRWGTTRSMRAAGTLHSTECWGVVKMAQSLLVLQPLISTHDPEKAEYLHCEAISQSPVPPGVKEAGCSPTPPPPSMGHLSRCVLGFNPTTGNHHIKPPNCLCHLTAWPPPQGMAPLGPETLLLLLGS